MNINVRLYLSKVLGYIFWSVIVGFTFYFLAGHVFKYLTKGIPEFFGDTLWDKRFWFYIHITGGTLAILIGPLQFWKRIRTKYKSFHRFAGKLYIIGSIVAVIGLIRILPESLCVACRPSQFVVTPLWLVCTIAAWVTIRKGNIKGHRQFMARSYLFAFYFVAVRILDMLGENIFSSFEKDSAWYANTDWMVWVLPLIILEIYQTWWPSYVAKSGKKNSIKSYENINSKVLVD